MPILIFGFPATEERASATQSHYSLFGVCPTKTRAPVARTTGSPEATTIAERRACSADLRARGATGGLVKSPSHASLAAPTRPARQLEGRETQRGAPREAARGLREGPSAESHRREGTAATGPETVCIIVKAVSLSKRTRAGVCREGGRKSEKHFFRSRGPVQFPLGLAELQRQPVRRAAMRPAGLYRIGPARGALVTLITLTMLISAAAASTPSAGGSRILAFGDSLTACVIFYFKIFFKA